MNKFLKFLLVGVFSLNLAGAWADDDTNADTATDETPVAVVGRMDCKEIKKKIDELTKSNADGDAEKLARFKSQYRKECSTSANGRRALGRTTSVMSAPVIEAKPVTNNTTEEKVTISDAQQEMCTQLKSAIDTESDSENKSVMQENYKKYCEDNEVAPDTVIKMYKVLMKSNSGADNSDANETSETKDEESVEEKAARIQANIDAGLCADGSKPNKFGCCPGETFKDLGNLQFGCCPETGTECFPPIK